MFFFAFFVLFFIAWALIYAALPAIRHLGRVVWRVAARSARVQQVVSSTHDRYKNYVPVLVILILGGFLTAWAGDSFLDVAEQVHARQGALQQTDTRVHDWAVSKRTADATLFFETMSTVGGPAGLAVIMAVVSIILLMKRRYSWFFYLAVTSVVGALLDWELKRYFARARPALAEMLRQAQGYSFPSGHAMESTIVFTSLSYIAFRAVKSWPAKAATLAFAYTFIAAVALSRVYLGVHWISDVAAGFTAGTVWVTTTTVAYETQRRIRRLRALRK